MGRTGCFIVIDAMLERIKHEKTVDIYGHVTLMRAQRNYMVQTEDQYVFIHDALQEAVNCGTTEVPARNLYAYIQKLTQIEGGENVTGMELEFKVQTVSWSKSIGQRSLGQGLLVLALDSYSIIWLLHITLDMMFHTNNLPYVARIYRHPIGTLCSESHAGPDVIDWPYNSFPVPIRPPDSMGPVVSSLFQLVDSLM